MQAANTDTFPYTISYICDSFGIDEAGVIALCNRLGIKPHKDELTNKLFFGAKDIERIREAVETQKTGVPLNTTPTKTSPAMTPVTRSTNLVASKPSSVLSRSDLSMIVESVSSAKEEILKDLSLMLDDRLAGLDDVVVELIRSKSEVDTLREALQRAETSRDKAQTELKKFKPTAFGFYRKEG